MCMLLSVTSTHFKWELMLYCFTLSDFKYNFRTLTLILTLLLLWRSGSLVDLSVQINIYTVSRDTISRSKQFFQARGFGPGALDLQVKTLLAWSGIRHKSQLLSDRTFLSLVLVGLGFWSWRPTLFHPPFALWSIPFFSHSITFSCK